MSTLDSDSLFVADFETVVDEDPAAQEETDVWSAAWCPVIKRPEPHHVVVRNNIYDFIRDLELLPDDSLVFFHNEKFDISFLLNALNDLNYTPAMSKKNPRKYASDWEQNRMPYTYKVSVSSMGQWYNCRIRFPHSAIQIRDSAKKIPSTLKEMGESFHTKYQKLEMQYENDANVKHTPFGTITKEELDYIKNDCLVLAEAMWMVWFKYNMKGMTIGADCLIEYKNIMGKQYDDYFPDMTHVKLQEQGCPENITAFDYAVKAYAGGWCWQNPISKKVVYKSDINYTPELQEKFDRLASKKAHLENVKNIIVVDVNSLYPSVMSSQCKSSYYPVGLPQWFAGEPTQSIIRKNAIIRRFKCRFTIKKGYLPFLHIRGSKFYDSNECLTTSDVNGDRYVKSRDGSIHDTLREYTMTQPEYELFRKHYNITDYSPIDYLVFKKEKGIFDAYIDKYAQMKKDATKSGDKALRQIAKLYLNNLYGKMGSTTNSSYKKIRFEDRVMKFDTISEYNKQTVFMPVAAYVTAQARAFTITAGQLNYFEGQHKGVVYSDTDSLHLVDMDASDLKGVPIHPTDFCHWACEESSCAYATYAKQKTYIEVATEEDFEQVKDKDGKPSYKLIVKAAGLGKEGKKMFTDRLFLDHNHKKKMYIDYFKSGLELKRANLKAKQVKGGIVLVPSVFKIS